MAISTDQSDFIFGPGSGWGSLIQFTDGTTPTIQQPRKFDVLQGMTMNFDVTVKRLMGSQIFPRAIGIGDGKVTAKVKLGRFESGIINLRYGQAGNPSTGAVFMADDEIGTIPAVTTFTVTVANSATWTRDWGVRYAQTGIPLTAMASAPSVGSYSVAAGVYTFNTADASKVVVISYEYTAITGTTVHLTNQLQGNFGLVQLRYQGVYGGRTVGVYIPNAVGSTFNIDSKEADFAIPEMDFECYADSTNNVAFLYLPN